MDSIKCFEVFDDGFGYVYGGIVELFYKIYFVSFGFVKFFLGVFLDFFFGIWE